MSLGFDVDFNGFDGLSQKLDKLPRRVEGKIARKAIHSGGWVIVKEARSRIKSRTGTLRKSIGTKAKRARRGVYRVQVGARSGEKVKHDGFYAGFVESGTKHAKKRPFLMPAFEAKLDEAVEAIAKRLREAIEKA